MRIAYVSDAIYPYNKGGKEKRLYEISTRLAKLGHEVHIYTMHWWQSSDKHIVENGLHLHAISKLHSMYSGDRRSIKEGILFGIACFKLFQVKFDVIDVDHMPFFPIYSSWLVCKIRGKKLYGTWHEALNKDDWVNYMGSLGMIAHIIEHISIKLPQKITSASEHTFNDLSKRHGRYNGLYLVTPGIDLNILKNISSTKIDCDILYVGRLVKDKNIDVLVRSVAKIAKNNPRIKCTIVGHGIEENRIYSLISKYKLQKNISLQKPLADDKEVYAFMKKAKVFCLPSVREGFGMVVLESIACDTPVVTINAPANYARHLVVEGETGSVVTLSADAIAKALNYWLNHKRSKSFTTQVASYDWNSLAVKQLDVYNQ